ncbi:MAG: prephenate dehydrogenase [Chloroflexota bacterium]|nr:prephenate dehydrogenase [Chloroflexota bacterium]
MNLTLVGLGLVGTSVGLGLKAVSDDISITGHDPEADKVKRAKELGAIDKSHWNLIAACEKADLVLLDVALDEMKTTLDALGGEVKEETVLLDTFALKRPVLELAQRLLPSSTRFVGGHVVSSNLRQTQEPSAALLQGATFFLVLPDEVDSEAVDMASNLAEAVGAVPRYIDAAEHDGLVAATLQLPLLSALTMANVLYEEAGAKERQQAIGGALADTLLLLSGSRDLSAEVFLQNRGNILRWLDVYAGRLGALRDLLAAGNRGALEEAVAKAREISAEWMGDAPSNEKETKPTRDGWRSLLFGGLGRR